MLIMTLMHQVLQLANVSEGFEAERSNEPKDTEPDRPRVVFSTFLLLQPFSTAHQTLLTPAIQLFCCYFVTVFLLCYES